MQYQDRLYGQTTNNEPVIRAIIDSPSFQRLKGVDQAGWFEPYHPNSRLSRFEHSIGVYLLLKRYGASLEEQIAGLIHDISHAAFSHCIDYVVKEGSPKAHDHQDNIFKDFVLKSEIPAILAKHKIEVSYILDDVNFPLKEKPLPDLCADRIDYSLRTAAIYDHIKQSSIDYILQNLVVENKQWVFVSEASAKKYAQLFTRLNTQYWAGFSSALMFQTVGDFLRYALMARYVDYQDLYTTDKEVLDKINKQLKKDNELTQLWRRMNNKVPVQSNPRQFDYRVFVKSRIVDPWFKQGKELKRLSDSLASWKEKLQKDSQPKEYFIKFLQP